MTTLFICKSEFSQKTNSIISPIYPCTYKLQHIYFLTSVPHFPFNPAYISHNKIRYAGKSVIVLFWKWIELSLLVHQALEENESNWMRKKSHGSVIFQKYNWDSILSTYVFSKRTTIKPRLIVIRLAVILFIAIPRFLLTTV